MQPATPPQMAGEPHLRTSTPPYQPAPTQTTITVQPADHVVTLVSQNVVNQRAFANSCGVPLSALVDFHPSEALGLEQVQRTPHRCKACWAFMNAHCKTNLAKAVWKCCFCGAANIPKPPAWSTDIMAFPELCSEAVEYVYPPPATPPNHSQRPHVVLVVDATLEDHMLEGLSLGVMEALAQLDPGTLVSVISFDGVVAMHSMEPGRMASVVLPGALVMDQTGVAVINTCEEELWRELGESRRHLEDVLAGVRPLQSGRPMRFRDRCLAVAVEAALRVLAFATGTSPGNKQESVQPIKVHPASKIVVLAGGPVTKGPGAVPIDILDSYDKLPKSEVKVLEAANHHAEALAAMAAAVGCSVDVVLAVTGAEGCNVPFLTALTKESGGEVWSHQEFGSGFGASLGVALRRRFGQRGILDCFTPEGVRLVQWIGPVDLLNEEAELNSTPERFLSHNARSIHAVQVGHGAALRCELTKDMEPQAELPLQVVFMYVDVATGRTVQRVITRKMKVVTTLAEFLPSINPAAAAVVCAKRLVLDARKSGAARARGKQEELRYAVAAQLGLLAARLGKQEQVSSGVLGFGKKKVQRLPQELLALATALYQLQRSQIMSPSTTIHPDTRSLVMSLLLSASSTAAAAMVLPTLYAVQNQQPERPRGLPYQQQQQQTDAGLPLLHPVQSTNLTALYMTQQEQAWVADGGWYVMVYQPANIPSQQPPPQQPPQQQQQQQYSQTAPAAGSSGPQSAGSHQRPKLDLPLQHAILMLSAGRCPMPDLMLAGVSAAQRQAQQGAGANGDAHQAMANGGAGNGDWLGVPAAHLLSCLVPVHNDTPSEQLRQVPPELGHYGEEYLRQLGQVLMQSAGEQSFLQWCRSQNIIL